MLKRFKKQFGFIPSNKSVRGSLSGEDDKIGGDKLTAAGGLAAPTGDARLTGFTVLEIIAVIFIASLGLIGVLALATQNIKVSSLNRNELIASQLAQEGLELVRNQRDKNWLDGNDWKLGAGAGSDSDIYQDGTYAIDYNNGITNVTGIDSPDAVLKINNGFYEHNSGTPTIFSRLITVIDNASDYMEIESNVRWSDRGQIYNYAVNTVLYDWR